MAKTQRELAFLRDLYVGGEWTRRFAELVDKNIEPARDANLLYINAGTGDHVIAMRDKLGDEASVFATCENDDILTIARDKAAAVRSDVDFSMIRFDDDAFENVVADASLVQPAELPAFIGEAARVTKPGGKLAVMMVSAGSFGEIFSLLWEVLLDDEANSSSVSIVEEIISELPTVSRIEEIFGDAGIGAVASQTVREVFDYDDGKAFVASPLIADFLLPVWLETMSEGEREKISENLARLIDAEDGTLSFRFTVKATVTTGRKKAA